MAAILPFAAASTDSLIAYPAGLPASLYADPIVLDSAADAVAVLAGLEWDALTPEQRNDARAFALLAATALHPDGLRFLSYSMNKTVTHDFSQMPAIVRAGYVERLMGALRGAALRCFGVANPAEHRALVDLVAQDAGEAVTRGRKGGW